MVYITAMPLAFSGFDAAQPPASFISQQVMSHEASDLGP